MVVRCLAVVVVLVCACSTVVEAVPRRGLRCGRVDLSVGLSVGVVLFFLTVATTPLVVLRLVLSVTMCL